MKKFAIITNAYKDKKLVLTHKIVEYITQKGGYAVALSEGHEGVDEYADINFSKDSIVMVFSILSKIKSARTYVF